MCKAQRRGGEGEKDGESATAGLSQPLWPCASTGAPPLTAARLASEPGLDVDPGCPGRNDHGDRGRRSAKGKRTMGLSRGLWW